MRVIGVHPVVPFELELDLVRGFSRVELRISGHWMRDKNEPDDEPADQRHDRHRMVTADVLVMSRSALSMAAALLSNGTVVFPRCWREFRRPLPSWRLLDCCANASEAVKGANCVQEGRRWKLNRNERVRAG